MSFKCVLCIITTLITISNTLSLSDQIEFAKYIREARSNVQPTAAAMSYIVRKFYSSNDFLLLKKVSSSSNAYGAATMRAFQCSKERDYTWSFYHFKLTHYLTDKNLTIKEVVHKWVKEGENYDIHKNTCTHPGKCDNYKILMNEYANQVGCSNNICEGKTLWICAFDFGQDINEIPYEVGKPCSKCGSAFTCCENLCKFGKKC